MYSDRINGDEFQPDIMTIGTDKIIPVYDRDNQEFYCKVKDRHDAEIYQTGGYSNREQAIQEAQRWLAENP